MSEEALMDYIMKAPDEWDYEHKRVWAKYQLSQDLKRESKRKIEQLQQENKALQARVARLEQHLSRAESLILSSTLYGRPAMEASLDSRLYGDEEWSPKKIQEAINETPAQSLAAIQSDAVDNYHYALITLIMQRYAHVEGIMASVCEFKKQYMLSQQGKD